MLHVFAHPLMVAVIAWPELALWLPRGLGY